jgi:hypothetical protein
VIFITWQVILLKLGSDLNELAMQGNCGLFIFEGPIIFLYDHRQKIVAIYLLSLYCFAILEEELADRFDLLGPLISTLFLHQFYDPEFFLELVGLVNLNQSV